ncbi:FIG00432396: hypothetical protein [plant metagenome]|uniref:FAD-binding PCMH-type domain-containing protein n=1 Tax=plant metagenome TaxID=1297885 RepID=A0A484SLD7_9ZZZZ
MSTSRRAFLFGRKLPDSGWQRFCQRLARTCQGLLRVAEDGDVADLAPLRAQDVRHALALCAEHGVQLALADASASRPILPTLRVDPSNLNDLAPLQGAPGFWRAGPGCTLETLAAAGCTQFQVEAGADIPVQTLAAWLSGPAPAVLCPTGHGLASGVAALDVLLADGSAITLGPFGAQDRQPLRGATLQALVPALFELSSSEDAARCLAAPRWPWAGRLDALQPLHGGVNLAHLLLGQGGALAWVESVLVTAMPAAPQAPARPVTAAGDMAAIDGAGARLADAVKQRFDPLGRFPALPLRLSDPY